MLITAEVFKGTYLKGVLKILEAEDYDPINEEKRKGEKRYRKMTPLEKALLTFIKRRKKGSKARKRAEEFLWDHLIYPRVRRRNHEDPPLGLRRGWVIVKRPVRPIT